MKGPGALRILTMAVFALSCVGLLIFLWLSFGGAVPLKPHSYRVQVAFAEAHALAEEADVRISGVTVGKVRGKERDPRGNKTLATLEIEPQFAPLPRDTRAMLRQKTLLGETYVELTPGTRDGPTLEEDARLPDAQVVPAVQLHDVLRLLDKPTRRAFKRWQAEQGKAFAGRGRDFNEALGSFPVFAENAGGLLRVLERRREALRTLVRDAGTVFAALSEDETALQQAIARTTEVFDTTAAHRDNLAEAIRIFPTFLDESRATFVRLEDFSRDTDPLIRELQPVAEDIPPTLRSLGDLGPDLRRLFVDLDPLIAAGDVGFPALSRVLRGLRAPLRQLGPFLGQLNPILRWLEVKQPTVSDFLNIGPSALGIKLPSATPNNNGHALPQIVVTGSQSILSGERTEDNRGNTYWAPDALAHDAWKDPDRFILPNWDCDHVGGPRPPGDTPGCFVQGDIPFQGVQRRFPHVEAEDYSRRR